MRLSTRARAAALVSMVGAAAALVGCNGGTNKAHTAATTATTTSTASTLLAPTVPSTTDTTLPATTTTTPPPPGLGVGARGPDVQALEQRLLDLHYDVGAVDGVFDQTTSYAVMAFQKVNGLPRTGRATDDVLKAVQTATDPAPLVPGGGATRVEVDLPRQVLFLYLDGSLFRILPVSTGSGERYCVDGECARAVTPGGSFRMTEFRRGWTTSRLGRLYNALFFNGGIAVHGALSVPAYPASHGCVRIPMSAAEWFPSKVYPGTPVYVAGGPIAPVPFNEAAPGEAPPTTSAAPPPAAPGAIPPPAPPGDMPPSTTSTTAAPPITVF